MHITARLAGALGLVFYLVGQTLTLSAEGSSPSAFYVAENTNFTIVASALDSVRFTLEKTLKAERDGRG
jgi:hypothetical protein